MLSTGPDCLTGLVSKHFIVSAFVPVLIVAFVNGAILYVEADWFRMWAELRLSGSDTTFSVVAFFFLLSVAAYVLWSLNGFLRQVLEGYRFGPDSTFGKRLRASQRARYEALWSAYVAARDAVLELSGNKQTWTESLTSAAVAGKQVHPNVNAYDGQSGPAAAALRKLKDARDAAGAPAVADLQSAVIELAALLRANDISAVHPHTEKKTLSIHREELLKLFDYAEDEWVKREAARRAQFDLRFASDSVAATALGNVAESMNAYAITRYRFDLTTFWSRLQPLLRKQEGFMSALQEAKEQVDFLVASVWLSAVTTVVWWVALMGWGDTLWLFLAVAVAGPTLTWVLYLAAVENYVAFAVIVRAAVDLYRFELLDALHAPRPTSLRQERLTWDALGRVSSFGQEWVDYSYRVEADTKE